MLYEGARMKLITAILREDAVDEVQIALAQQGISGMTVTEVSGYARQRGHTEVYRGEEFTIDFITKIRWTSWPRTRTLL